MSGSLLLLALSIGSDRRERCLWRGIQTSLLRGERCNCVCTIADHCPGISSLCQVQSPKQRTLWSLHLQELHWQCLIEKQHQTQNKILQCLPSHRVSCGTVFWSLFLAKELSLHDDITFPTDTYCIPHANAHFGSRKQLRNLSQMLLWCGERLPGWAPTRQRWNRLHREAVKPPSLEILNSESPELTFKLNLTLKLALLWTEEWSRWTPEVQSKPALLGLPFVCLFFSSLFLSRHRV